MKKIVRYLMIITFCFLCFIISGCQSKPIEITGLSFESQEFTYDGNSHSLSVKGNLPEGVSVSYSNNNHINAGTYEVVASFNDETGKYIVPNSLTATLTIKQKVIDWIVFEDKNVPYDEKEHSIEIKGELPDGVEVSYTGNNQKEIGSYKVTASFSDTTGNYIAPSNMMANLQIYNDGSYHTVTFVNENDEKSFLVKSGTLFEKVPELPSKIGHTASWGYDFSKPILEDLICNLTYELTEYDIIYHLPNGVENNPNNPYSYTYESNDITLHSLDLPKDMYFEGWYTNPICTNKITTISKGSTSNINLYPKIIDRKIVSAEGFDFDYYDIELPKLSLTVPSEIVELDLSSKISVSNQCQWFLSLEKNGINKIENKILSLVPGLNYAYIIVSYKNESSYIYLLEVYRMHSYQYVFVIDETTIISDYTEENSYINKPQDPTKIGHDFVGWKLENSDNYISFPYQITKDTTFYAVWDAQTYDITFDLVGGNMEDDLTITKDYGSTIILPTPKKEGYSFDGWKNKEGEIFKKTFLFEETSNIILEAVWKNNEYKITYISEGTTPEEPQIVVYGEPYSLFESYLKGYTHTGYFLDNKPFIINQVWNIAKDITLYATFEINTYEITYLLDGGTNHKDNIYKFTHVDSFKIYDPTKTGYKFEGWYIDKEYTTLAQKEYSNRYSHLFLYAKWSKKEYIINYISEGSLPEKTQTVIYDEPYTLYESNLIGYNHTGYLLEEEKFIPTASWNIDHDITLTATFEIATYTITYHLLHGTNNENNISTFTYFDTFEIYDPNKNEAFFEGWFLDPEYQVEAPTKYSSYNNHLTLYAKWLSYDDIYAGTDFTLKTYSNQTAAISEYVGKDTQVIVPNRIKQDGTIYTIKQISNRAFSKNTSITSVYISEGIESLGMYVFEYCSNLENIYIPESLTHFSDGVFQDCTSLKNIEFPQNDNQVFLPPSLFYNCTSLETVILPKKITSISMFMFSNCTSLKSIYLNENIKEIADNAFSGCTNLSEITLPASLKTLGKSAFYGCASLKNITIPNNVSSIKDNTFYGCTSLENIELHNNITSLGAKVFYNCTNLKSIEIPDGISKLTKEMFYKCTSLENITIPASLTTIENNTFVNNGTSLRHLYYKGNIDSLNLSILKHFANFASFKGYHLYTLNQDGSWSEVFEITIPESITIIENRTFYKLSFIKNIYLHDNITRLEIYSFNLCSSLEKIHLPNKLVYIGEGAFEKCNSLKEIILPNTLETISRYAFQSCSSLETVIVPKSVTSIGYYAFKGCNNLKLYCEIDTIPSGWENEWNPDNQQIILNYIKS